MTWPFLAHAEQVRRRLWFAALALLAIALLAVAYKLGAQDDACEPPPIEEAAEAYLLDHPECVDGGAQ